MSSKACRQLSNGPVIVTTLSAKYVASCALKHETQDRSNITKQSTKNLTKVHDKKNYISKFAVYIDLNKKKLVVHPFFPFKNYDEILNLMEK